MDPTANTIASIALSRRSTSGISKPTSESLSIQDIIALEVFLGLSNDKVKSLTGGSNPSSASSI